VHELSIALSIIEGAQEEAVRQGNPHIEAVHLRMGPLSGVVQEALIFSYGLACEGTTLEGSRLVIDEVPVTFFCAQCAGERSPVSIMRMYCPVCGMPAGEILTGSELEIAALELAT
jgi:hydrogenase nickel incorporation protein HypA/HybF